MINRYQLSSIIRFSLLSVLLITGCAQTGIHKKHDAPVPKICKKPDTLPTLRCASAPSALFDAQGRLRVVWVYGGHVYLSTSTDQGQTFKPPLTVNRIPEVIYAKGENRPKLAFGPDGQIYISWTQKLTQKRFSGHIRFSRSTDGGKHFSDPITVNDHRAITSHRFDALEVNKHGDIYVAWLDKRDLLAAKKTGKAYNGAALYYALSTNGGKTFQANKKIKDQSCQCCRVAMAIDTDQLPVILWRHIFDDNIRDHALVKFAGRNKPGKPRRASFDNWHVEGCPHHGPAISIADDGIYHLTWFNNAPERHGLFYAQSQDKARSFSKPINVGDYSKAAAHAHVLSLGQHVLITWKEFDGKQASLLVMQSSNGGQSWSSPQQLAKSKGPTDHPFLLQHKQQAYVSWHRKGEDYKLIPVVNQ